MKETTLTMQDLEIYDNIDYKIHERILEIITLISELQDELEDEIDFLLDVPSSYVDYDISVKSFENGLQCNFVYEAPYEDLFDENIDMFFSNELLTSSNAEVKNYYKDLNADLNKTQVEMVKIKILRTITNALNINPSIKEDIHELLKDL